MCNYTKGQIYMLEPKCDYEEGDIYYGSTIQPLSKRIAQHRNKSNDCNSKILIEKYGKVKIVLVKLFPCNSKQELEAEEAKYIRENKCINKIIPLRTQKEWYEDNKEQNKEKNKEYFKEYRMNNPEKIAEYNKKYRMNNPEKIKEWYEDNKDYIKDKKNEWRENNKEKIKEYSKEYRMNNLEKLLEKSKEKITCECGCIITKTHIYRHKQTPKHLKNMP